MTHEDPEFDTTSDLYVNADKAQEEGKTLYSKRGDSADEIDPRKLVRNPTLSEIRWYYRRTFAKKLVDKPIEDAFKNDFELEGTGASRANSLMENVGYIEEYQLAEKKARRDGFALLFIGTRESGSSGVEQSPFDEGVRVMDITHVKTLTIDDLAYGGAADEIVEQVQVSYPELDADDIYVRRTGIVISTDIQDPNFREPIGYALQTPGGAQFIHKDRVQHLVWNPEVDGDYHMDSHRLGVSRFQEDTRTLGRYEGDSVLIPSYDLLKGITKGNWAIMQALYRNAASMYTVYMPRDASEDDHEQADKEFTNMNAKSEFIIPGGPPGQDENSYEVVQHESQLADAGPREHFDVLFDQICASNEMTKSVLFGTQSGTVSGSETDIKNYFNKVERYRRNRAESKIHEFTDKAAQMLDGRTTDQFSLDYEFEWGPLFRVSQMDRVTMIQNMGQTMGVLINNYVLTPDEARSIMEEEWAEFEGLDPLTEEEWDDLDRVQLAQVGQFQGVQAEEQEQGVWSGNPSAPGNNGGGMAQGQQTGEFADSKNPRDYGGSQSDNAEFADEADEDEDDDGVTYEY